jgi:hypothetical protein
MTSMLPPEDAKRLADRVLEAERRASLADNPWLHRTPIVLRCDELKGLEEHEQWAVRQAAEREAQETRSLQFAVAVLMIATFGALALWLAGKLDLNGWLIAYLLAVMAPFAVYSRWVVRPLVQRKALDRHLEKLTKE